MDDAHPWSPRLLRVDEDEWHLVEPYALLNILGLAHRAFISKVTANLNLNNKFTGIAKAKTRVMYQLLGALGQRPGTSLKLVSHIH